MMASFLSAARVPAGQAASQLSPQAIRHASDSPGLGLAVLPINDQVKDAWRKDNIPRLRQRGLLVDALRPGSPAALAGIKPNDVIVVKADRKTLVSPVQLAEWVSTLEVGRPYRLTVHRPLLNKHGRMIWKKINVSVEPTTRAKVEDGAVRYGYLRLDDRWIELPVLDFSNPSSQTHPFVPPKGRYYESPGGGSTWTSDRRRRPRGARDITRRVISQKRREWKELLPRIAVGEHGKIMGFEVIQVLGQSDLIVQMGLEDLGWTLIGVPDRYEWVRLTNVQTTGLVDGRRATFDDPIAIFGTWNYTTTLGARKTIFLAAPVQALQRGLSDAELKELRAWLESHKRP